VLFCLDGHLIFYKYSYRTFSIDFTITDDHNDCKSKLKDGDRTDCKVNVNEDKKEEERLKGPIMPAVLSCQQVMIMLNCRFKMK
jgi:hypothetical protein